MARTLLLRWRNFGAVIFGINTGIIHRTIDLNPVCIIDSTLVITCRARWKRRNNFNPTILLLGESAYLICKFRKILILAKYNGNIEFIFSCCANNIECNSNVDAFFLRHKHGIFCAVWQLDFLISISQKSRIDRYSTMSKRTQFRCPEFIPKRAMAWVWYAGIETNPPKRPIMINANPSR